MSSSRPTGVFDAVFQEFIFDFLILFRPSFCIAKHGRSALSETMTEQINHGNKINISIKCIQT